MAGFAGLIRWDRAPVAREQVLTLLRAAAHRGPAGDVWVGDGAAAGVHVSATGATALRSDAETGCVLAFHGRLDNAADLAVALGLRATAPDADVILAAYEKWRGAAVSRLLGAFALVIWDARRRAVLAARDAFGLRPLVYTATDRMFAWASDLAPLVRLRQPRINEGMVGEFLSDRITSLSDTLFEGILRLPMAHALDATTARVVVSRYWTPVIGEPSRRTAADLEVEFRHRLGRVVCSELRDTSRAVVMLSGGRA